MIKVRKKKQWIEKEDEYFFNKRPFRKKDQWFKTQSYEIMQKGTFGVIVSEKKNKTDFYFLKIKR